MDLQGRTLLTGTVENSLYRLHQPPRHLSTALSCIFLGSKINLQTFHERLDHPHESCLKRLDKSSF
ncbi:unnamed protein product [Rhodiola kirilowii]